MTKELKMDNKTKKIFKIIFIVSVIIVFAWVGYMIRPRYVDGIIGAKFRNDNVKRIAPDRLYPNPKWTTGKLATTSIEAVIKKYPCNFKGKKLCSYSQVYRDVSGIDKKQIYIRYGVKYPQPLGKYEVDHFCPLCGGGSNDKGNLWLQPKQNEYRGVNYGFIEKDKLESWLCKKIKKKEITPLNACLSITTDWVRYYIENMKEFEKQKLGGGDKMLIGDDYE